jgi:hypothetical protein
MSQPSDAYMEGYMAAEDGKPRECINPRNVQWQREWLRGYDEAADLLENSN